MWVGTSLILLARSQQYLTAQTPPRPVPKSGLGCKTIFDWYGQIQPPPGAIKTDGSILWTGP